MRLKGERITLLIIPEAGGKTFELKVPRLLLVLGSVTGAAVLVLLALGLHAWFEARDLGRAVVRLEREKALLEEEVVQIEQLEEVLVRLQRSNDQLRAILGETTSMAPGAVRRGATGEEPYISSVQRLRWGQVHSVPSLWPAEGAVRRSFDEAFQAVAIALPEHSLVRASAAGKVARAGYDVDLGYLVQIDHGNGLSSWYGYNARLLVGEGEHVFKGQPLALSGRTGGVEAPALYYAVEENGQRRNPLLYRLWL